MKILWSVNIIFPDISKALGQKAIHQGGWMVSLAKELKNNIEIEKIAIATTYKGKELKKMELNNIKYYLIPLENAKFKYNNHIKSYWIKIIEDFNPSIIHIHGTEYCHSTPLLDMGLKIPIVTSIQGLLSECYKNYLVGISLKERLVNRTIIEYLLSNGMIEQKYKYGKRALNEKEIIKKSNYIIGRTTWDNANIKKVNNNVKYFHCDEMLRDDFYRTKWNISNIERNTIFISQASYPIKGLHIFLEALYYLKNYYKDVKVYIGGNNILKNDSIMSKIKRSGYSRYIYKLIKKYNLSENITFLGQLNSREMNERLLKSHVFVIPSVIENSPNSLGEAQLIGVPCIGSFVGGIPDMIIHNKSGLLYNSTESSILSEMIKKVFDSDDFANYLSKNEIEQAMVRHNKEKILEDQINIYTKIINISSSSDNKINR